MKAYIWWRESDNELIITNSKPHMDYAVKWASDEKEYSLEEREYESTTLYNGHILWQKYWGDMNPKHLRSKGWELIAGI